MSITRTRSQPISRPSCKSFVQSPSRYSVLVTATPARKKPQERMEPFRNSSDASLGPTFKTKSKSRRSRSLHGSTSMPSSYTPSLSLASAPRTVEIMWEGVTAPGFTLKRKRTGLIVVSTLTHEMQRTSKLEIGSTLRLVCGFPVDSLTLEDVKKVMLMAPKPMSLVFVNARDVLVEQGDYRKTQKKALRRLSASSTVSSTSVGHSTSVETSNFDEDDGKNSDSDSDGVSSIVSAPTFPCTPSRSKAFRKPTVSKLQVALRRIDQLLNRPVRRSSLHSADTKSIIV